ncbi:MADS-box domain-containing protein [Heracleum sosnowskyi]|uniref:MADS-box domain-containing protein n=1 Tax=Heracleum sosnowskyi TaxID=360622 RepID=A0AAD8JLB5_9APIA|nr:MADS-box domain-containing protein [Heracleum sosnowskyi]
MGRAKLNMELVKKEKARNTTFHVRKNSLKKKVYELSTLCGIKAMMIIYRPKQVTPHARTLEPEIFPENRDEVLELVNIYKGQPSEDRKKRTSLLSYFFQERARKAQQVLVRLRNTNAQSMYPTWDSRFSTYTEEDLGTIAAFLENNIENAKARLGQMKANNTNSNDMYCAYLQQQRMLIEKRNMNFEDKYVITSDPRQTEFMRMPVPMPMPIQQQEFPLIDHYQCQMIVRSGHGYVGDTSNIMHNAHPSQPLYNNTAMAETGDIMTYLNNLVIEPPNNYIEGRQPVAQHLMEYHPIRPGSTHHQMVRTSNQVDTHAQFYEDHKGET